MKQEGAQQPSSSSSSVPALPTDQEASGMEFGDILEKDLEGFDDNDDMDCN